MRIFDPASYINNDMQPVKYLLVKTLGAGETGAFAYDVIDVALGVKGVSEMKWASKTQGTLEVVGTAETLEDINNLKDAFIKSDKKSSGDK